MTAWIFSTPRRLYGSLAAALVVGMVLASVVIGVRVSSMTAGIAAERAEAAASPSASADPLAGLAPSDREAVERSLTAPTAQPASPDSAASVAVAHLRKAGHSTATTSIQATDGLVTVVEVLTLPAGSCEVVLILDGSTQQVDQTTCTP